MEHELNPYKPSENPIHSAPLLNAWRLMPPDSLGWSRRAMGWIGVGGFGGRGRGAGQGAGRSEGARGPGSCRHGDAGQPHGSLFCQESEPQSH